MSTEVVPVDENELKSAIASIRADDGSSSKGSYIVAGHSDGNPNSINVVAKGSGGCVELVSCLEDSQVMYVLLRTEEVFDMSTTVKFVYIHWVGDKVPFARKGRYGVVHGSVQRYFEPYHVDFETSSRDDLSDELIDEKISGTSGTRSKVLDSVDASTRSQRGFTSVPTNQPPKVKTSAPAVSKKGADVNFNSDVPEALADVRSDITNTNWTVVGYEDKDVKKPLAVIGSGLGGLDDIVSLLDDDAVMYGLYRVTDKIDDSITVKFVYISWVGEKVKPMAKGKVSTHKGAIEELFLPAHITVYASERKDISELSIMDKVQSASGSKSHVKTT